MRPQRQTDPRTQPELRSLVAPTGVGDLILPAGAVAEVVAYDGEIGARPGGVDWLLGRLQWRNHRVPVMDLGRSREVLDSGTASGYRRRHPSALICVTPSGNQALPYVGLLVAATPRLVRLRAADIEPAAAGPERVFTLYHLEYLGQPAWVPDLDRIEREVLALGPLGS
jgi:chemosensory pili system protein ChpC